MKHPVNERRKYIAFAAGFAAFDIIINACLNRGFDLPVRNPITQQWIVERDVLSWHEWRNLKEKYPIVLGLTWLFFTSGPSLTLASDFNTAANHFYGIGSGAGGQGGGASNTPCPCTGTQSGSGGFGGGAGAISQLINYSGHSAGQVVSIQVGTGDTIFDSGSVLVAKAASGQNGGLASACVGQFPGGGGNGGSGGTGVFGIAPTGGGGGGGGGAAGPIGSGSNGQNGAAGTPASGQPSVGGVGGNGDGDTVPGGNASAGSNGSNLGPTGGGVFAGAGGGGAGGNGIYFSAGQAGYNAGFYGGGGGGGGGAGFGSGGGGGAATQGFLGYSYTPSTGSPYSFAVIMF